MEAWKTDMKHFLVRSGESFFGANAIASSVKWHSDNGFSVLYIVKENNIDEKLSVLFNSTKDKIKRIKSLAEADWTVGAINMLTVPEEHAEQFIQPVLKAIVNVKNCFFGFDEVPVPESLLGSDEIGELAYLQFNRIGIKYPFDSLPKIAHQVNFEVISPLK